MSENGLSFVLWLKKCTFVPGFPKKVIFVILSLIRR